MVDEVIRALDGHRVRYPLVPRESPPAPRE
jgi:hypothetical protein